MHGGKYLAASDACFCFGKTYHKIGYCQSDVNDDRYNVYGVNIYLFRFYLKSEAKQFYTLETRHVQKGFPDVVRGMTKFFHLMFMILLILVLPWLLWFHMCL